MFGVRVTSVSQGFSTLGGRRDSVICSLFSITLVKIILFLEIVLENASPCRKSVSL